MAEILAGGSGLPRCQCTLQGPGTDYASCSGSEMIVPGPSKNQWCHRAHLTTPWTTGATEHRPSCFAEALQVPCP